MLNTLLGFDFGLRYIGVATGQTITKSASPLTTLQALSDGTLPWAALDKLIQEWHPDALIVGLPFNMDGSEQSITLHVRKFIEQLKIRYPYPVFTVDERLTTQAAKEKLFSEKGYKGLSRDNINAVSAQLILESWLHEHR